MKKYKFKNYENKRDFSDNFFSYRKIVKLLQVKIFFGNLTFFGGFSANILRLLFKK